MGGYIMTSKTIEWGTPKYLFDELNAEFGFTVDVCASDGMQVCERYFNPQTDGLAQDWDSEVAYMNCPYGRDIPKWVEKASKSKGVVVALLPAKTDTRYFDLIFRTANEIRFIIGRVKFREGGGLPAPFGSMIVIWNGSDRRPLKVSLQNFKDTTRLEL